MKYYIYYAGILSSSEGPRRNIEKPQPMNAPNVTERLLTFAQSIPTRGEANA
jgi:hypothetical protein